MESIELSTRRTFKRLVEGRLLTCPRCKRQHDLLQYVRLQMIEEFARDTTPVYKCPECKWLFAPCDDLVLYVLNRMNGEGNGDSKLAED